MEFLHRPKNCLYVLVFTIFILRPCLAVVLYVDSVAGEDTSSGVKEHPFKSLEKASEIVRNLQGDEAVTVRLNSGIYSLSEKIIWESSRAFTETERLTIEALILPDDPAWKPDSMPVLVSNVKSQKGETYTFEIKESHVTIRGLRFLGNPSLNNWHCCVSRVDESLTDIVVSQCVFIGAQNAADIYCAALAAGDGFVVENSIFWNCSNAVVFWDGLANRPSAACAMRNCIINNARMGAVWTCRTKDDFDFHNNIISNSHYIWIREEGPAITYKLQDCVFVNNQLDSGFGIESGPTGPTGPEITFQEFNVVRQGKVEYIETQEKRNYLHITPDTLGSNLNAGLFLQEIK